MSAFCIDRHKSSSVASVSAPQELDSDRADDLLEPSSNTPQDGEDYPNHSLLVNTGPRGLGMALEEELAILTGERVEDSELAALETPVSGQDTDLLSLLRQKEKDLVLAAKLGKALLERNQDLTKQYDKMNKDLNERLEHLEQEKHELRCRLERREGEWESRVCELESDVLHMQGELERQQAQLREADREKARAIATLTEHNHNLLEQLNRAAEVERQLSTQVHSLRDDFRERSVSNTQHMSRLESLQAEIKTLSERKRDLERRVNAMLEENAHLQNTLENLRDRTLVLEKQCHEKDLQLRQGQLELQEVRLSHRQLSARLEELADEKSLSLSTHTHTLTHTLTHTHANTHTPTHTHTHSLLSEIEQSMEQEELEQEREQLRLQLWEAYCQVRSICSQLRGNDITDSALSTDSSMDESSETLSAKDLPTGSLHSSLLELRRLTQNILDGNESTGSRRSDEEALEDQVRKLSEELRSMKDLYESEQERTHTSQDDMLQLHNQVALLSVEVCSWREETERLRKMADMHEPNEQLQSAIKDRDDAIAKKKAVEMELAKCKIDIMSLNSQLLDAIQQKLNLSQQLEAWQDDMQRVIDQQLMDKHQEEWDTPYSFSSANGGSRRTSGSASRRSHRDRRLFSFFKKN
ncbi:BICD family-like cargo adapter 1 [Engraulis encrasicolus]|uniref:BICD family-like cargo adapter 1 n=1 Tax=Engraulis encrasicolus TaxID=184585 RepID=UPI002FD776C1